uniref:Uncharacterized protein n=1 Tax=Triticum urartu TaxID=4572 RepID=A0A8R7U7X6_TRIUA
MAKLNSGHNHHVGGVDFSSSSADFTSSCSRSIRRRYTSSSRILCCLHFSPSMGIPRTADGCSRTFAPRPSGDGQPPMPSMARTISLNRGVRTLLSVFTTGATTGSAPSMET